MTQMSQILNFEISEDVYEDTKYEDHGDLRHYDGI